MVERTLGKGEVGSSILPCGTRKALTNQHLGEIRFGAEIANLQKNAGTLVQTPYTDGFSVHEVPPCSGLEIPSTFQQFNHLAKSFLTTYRERGENEENRVGVA